VQDLIDQAEGIELARADRRSLFTAGS